MLGVAASNALPDWWFCRIQARKKGWNFGLRRNCMIEPTDGNLKKKQARQRVASK